MAAGIYHLYLEQGTYHDVLMTYFDAADDPIDLTGYEAKLQIRKRKTSPDVVLELSTDNGGIILGSGDGTVRIVFTDEQTAALPHMSGFYDIKLTPPSGQAERFLQGDVEVSQAVTQ